MIHASFVLTALALAQPAAPAQADIDALVQESLKHWQPPGLAVVVVHQDRVLYLEGHGVRTLGSKDAVSPDTVFPLASCTKPFTTTALGMLVDEGKVGWDDPVRKYLPWFQLADPLADANVTLRDLLTHRTGLGRHDWIWYRTPLSVADRARRLAHLQPTHSFRAVFEYQPIAFGAAGLALEQAAGTSWAQFMTERLLQPLGMKATSAVFTKDSADLASPHRQGKTGIEVIVRYPLEEPDPAGSIHTTARDLAAFLRLQLNGGRWQGRGLVRPATLAELHRPQMLIRREGFAEALNPDTRVLSYALGWIAQDYRGQGLLMHGGAIEGFRAHLTLVPEAGLGIGILNNLDRTFMNVALSNRIVDRCCGLPARDWDGYFLALQTEDLRQRKAELARTLAQRRPGTKPSLPLDSYVGDYVDRAYGTCQVRLEDGKLRWRWGPFDVPLEHFHYDTFVARSDPVLHASVVFQLDLLGDVESVKTLERTFTRKK